MPNRKKMLAEMQANRAKLKAVLEVWPEGRDKEAVKYYIDYGSALDTATPDTVVEVVANIITSSVDDAQYMAGLDALRRGPMS